MKLLKMEKDKSLLKIYFEGYETKPITYNFNTAELKGVSGRKIKRIASKFRNWDYCGVSHLSNLERALMHLLDYYDNDTDVQRNVPKELAGLENFWNYQDIFKSDPGFPDGVLPKGYINFCKDNGLMIDYRSSMEFRLYQATKQGYTKDELEFINRYFILEHHLYEFILDVFETAPHDFAKTILHIIRNTVNDSAYVNDWTWRHFIQNLYCNNEAYIDGYKEYLDKDRDADFNLKQFEAFCDVVQNQGLEITLSRIKSIANIETEHLCIKVPLGIADLKQEGEQQKNCVGYHYNASIKEGKNFIYFIRRKDNPDKSYITCRYSTGYNSGLINYHTAEARTSCNGWNVDNELETAEIIAKVDLAILNILKSESIKEE